MTIRKTFFWMHLAAGSLAGIVILIMAVTGVLLTFERQIVKWADRDFRPAPPAAGTARLPVEALLEKVQAAEHAAPTTLTRRAGPASPAAVEFGRERIVYVDPYNGAILGEGSRIVRAFFQNTEQWHRWLAMSGASRDTARTVTGIANLLFLFLVTSGFYLWWPKYWTWKYLRPAVWFRGGRGARARDWNWHNTIGFWCAIPLFVVVSSGVVMSFPWANDLVYRVTGNEAPPRRAENGGGGGRGGERAGGGGERGGGKPSTAGLNDLWARAEAQTSGWQSISLRLPPGREAVFTIDAGNGGQPNLRSTLTLNRKTGTIVRWEPFESLNSGRRLRSWLRFLHTGEALGIPGQIVAGIASTGAAVLVWTGISLALRRLARARARRPAAEAVTA